MAVSNEQLAGWTGPSSDTEQDKQERTERMIREAITAHPALEGFDFDVYTKGSYANKTNVRTDSDVDVVVECREVTYWEEFDATKPGRPSSMSAYEGEWTPAKLRSEVRKALEVKFPGEVTSGSTAFEIDSSSARVDADVVPCFSYRMYFSDGTYRDGTKLFKKDGTAIVNYSKLQLKNGGEKDKRTGGNYKKAVRILKRLENVLVSAGLAKEVPSYLMECLIYNCPDRYFTRSSWRSVMQGCLADIYNYLRIAEPVEEADRWVEVNGAKFLFSNQQKWNRAEVFTFAKVAWDYMGFED